MSQILCLDFGTSSLRAALLDITGIQSVLPIGLTVRSALDDASIRSDILLSSDGSKIYLAEEAIKLRSTQQYLLYDASPKLWLKDPDDLSELIFPRSKITREMLLTALVAYALSACINAAKFTKAEFNKLDIRMSHPIWEESVAAKINGLHENILRTAIKLAPEIKNGVISTDIFAIKYFELVNTIQTKISKKIEVLEPIAAALTLFPNQDNVPRICTVIDIGAGTTDIGIFKVLYPDEFSDKKRSLIPIGKAISLFTAGNAVDRILLDHIISEVSTKIKDDQIKEVETRIRQIKERLFSDGVIRELDVNLKLKDFITNPKLKNIYGRIRTAIQNCLSDPENNKTLEPFFRNRGIKQLDVVMGGGGGSLSFITFPLKSEHFNLGNNLLSVNILKPNTELSTPLFNASIERLAVALGGSNYEYENLKTKHTEPIYFMRGSM
jgi:molecular chaperone HscA